MARTEVLYSDLIANGSIAEPAGTALTAGVANGHVVNDAVPELTVLRVNNTTLSAKIVTIVAGDNPPALAAGQGNLAVTVAASSVRELGPFESGRFIQNDGTLLVDVEAAMTGFVTAFKVPRGT